MIGPEWDRNLEELRQDGEVDLVVFTGDLADWGHETDYAMGVAFLRRTCEALSVPLERLFLVPGNHDVARNVNARAWKTVRERFDKGGLRLLREEVLPCFDGLGVARERAVTKGKIVDVLVMRGEVDEGLRLLREEVLPCFDRLGAVRERAVTSASY